MCIRDRGNIEYLLHLRNDASGNVYENSSIDAEEIVCLLYTSAVLVHVVTTKGKGYGPAEQNPSRFHGVDPFDIETGKPLKEKQFPGYTDVFSEKLCELAEKRCV